MIIKATCSSPCTTVVSTPICPLFTFMCFPYIFNNTEKVPSNRRCKRNFTISLPLSSLLSSKCPKASSMITTFNVNFSSSSSFLFCCRRSYVTQIPNTPSQTPPKGNMRGRKTKEKQGKKEVLPREDNTDNSPPNHSHLSENKEVSDTSHSTFYCGEQREFEVSGNDNTTILDIDKFPTVTSSNFVEEPQQIVVPQITPKDTYLLTNKPIFPSTAITTGINQRIAISPETFASSSYERITADEATSLSVCEEASESLLGTYAPPTPLVTPVVSISSNTLSNALPIVHPFTGRVISRSSPAIKQLINAGFTIEDNAIALKTHIQNINFKSLKNKSVRRAVESFLEDPDGDDRIQDILKSAGDSVLGTYLPPKLETLHDPILEEIIMTVDQQNVLNLVLSGYCVYIGGSAGTGKTVLLKAINRELSSRGIRIAMCATTGVASVQLGGSTFHYAFGVPMTDHGRWDVQALRAVDVIVIDEVSLLDRGILEAFNRAAQLARLSDRPFGGMQVILCGDFMQLAMGVSSSLTVPDNNNNNTVAEDPLDTNAQSLKVHSSVQSPAASLSEDPSKQPCFMSPLFKHLVPMQLVTVLRHKKGDPLLNILRKLRIGEYVPELEELNKEPPEDSCATYIFPKRRSVNAVNNLRLSALNTDMCVYTPQRGPTQLMGNFTECCIAHIPVMRKEGFHESVLSFLSVHGYDRSSLSSDSPRAPNDGFRPPSVGSLADVVVMPLRFLDNQYSIRYRQPKGGAMYNKIPAVSKQVWIAAVTDAVHAAGGNVLEFIPEEPEGIIPHSAYMSGNLSEVHGGSSMVNVCGDRGDSGSLILKLGCRVMVRRNLSRSVSNGSIGTVEAFRPYTQELQPKKRGDDANGGPGDFIPPSRVAFDRTAFPLLPVLRMQNGDIIQIPPSYEVVGGGPRTYYYGHALYTLPLQLGYAFTVHKVQGLTLDGPVVLDCEDFFNCPHLVYVACSRVRTLSQLTVKGLRPNKLIVDPPSLAFAKSIPSAANQPSIPAGASIATWAQKLMPKQG